MGEIRILAVSHGVMAEGMVRAVRMVAGNLGFLDYLCLDETCSIEQFKKQLSEKLDSMKDAQQILVLADIQGGSPFTSSVEQLGEKGLLDKSFVIAGMNLPLMLTLAFQQETVTEDALQALIAEAKAGMKLFQNREDEDEDL